MSSVSRIQSYKSKIVNLLGVFLVSQSGAVASALKPIEHLECDSDSNDSKKQGCDYFYLNHDRK